jgi:NADP-dependent 3-hydroxy acid dehydrogenase YdfG
LARMQTKIAFPSAVVTGAASGIGRAMAHILAAGGTRLVLADREPDALDRVVAELAAVSEVRPVVMEVASPDDNERLAATAGAPHLVCLNAGVTSAQAEPVWATPPHEWRRVLDVNLGGVVNGLRAFVPPMLEAGGARHLLITASLAGLATWPGGGAYAASKHAVVAVAEQAALSLAGTGVSVTVLCPALVRTGMSEIGEEPAAVAAAALEAVHGDRFLVVPAEWAGAVRARGDRLAAGLPPNLPHPKP